MAKLKHEKTILHENGVTTISKSFSTKTTSDAFFMCFIDNMSGLFKITCATDSKVLAKLCSMAEFNTGKVGLTPGNRKLLMEAIIGLSTQNLSHSLGRLKKLGLIAGDKGDYEINPKVFWKGTTDERNKLLKNEGLEISIKFQIKDNLNQEENE
jgi:hypothetical protein